MSEVERPLQQMSGKAVAVSCIGVPQLSALRSCVRGSMTRCERTS